jgi:hypothetical protein
MRHKLNMIRRDKDMEGWIMAGICFVIIMTVFNHLGGGHGA